MRKRTRFLTFAILLFIMVNFVDAQSQTRGMVKVIPPIPQLKHESIGYRQSWALIIGIDKYQDYPQLKTAVKGAKAFAKKLKKFGFPDKHIIELYDENATKDSIEFYLQDFLVRKSENNDRVLVYFGGHGDTYQNKIGYLCPYDAQKNRLPFTAISMNSIEDVNKLLPAKHVLYILDCCFSGMAAYTRGGLGDLPLNEKNYYKKLITRKARQIITAGQNNELAFDVGPGGQYSPFTYFLLEGMESNKVQDEYHVIQASKLGEYVKEKVGKYTGGKQTPIITRFPDSEEGDLLLWEESMQPKIEFPDLTFQFANGSLTKFDKLIRYQNKKYGRKNFVVLLWDRYCVPCINELKALNTMSFPSSFLVITINLDDPNKTSDFTLAKNLIADYPNFINLFLITVSQKAELIQKLKFQGTPLTLLMDVNKNIILRKTGFNYSSPISGQLLYTQLLGSAINH